MESAGIKMDPLPELNEFTFGDQQILKKEVKAKIKNGSIRIGIFGPNLQRSAEHDFAKIPT
jgi:hypothetical protein